ncbi:hypothetical protein RA276_30530, partial [Pseudomonas syringae pv. tagetis]|uniref:hypothetical protein n=1 Tax=Pseudomonas syringae group genomosp. 7 TaxID=251699 RepID=UPI0037700CA0
VDLLGVLGGVVCFGLCVCGGLDGCCCVFLLVVCVGFGWDLCVLGWFFGGGSICGDVCCLGWVALVGYVFGFVCASACAPRQ